MTEDRRLQLQFAALVVAYVAAVVAVVALFVLASPI